MNNLRSLSAGITALVLTTTASAGVIVVDAAGGGQFTDIQHAVNNAQEGDTLLVRPGAYTAFDITSKSLTVIADSGGVVTVAGTILIQDLAQGQFAVLSGLTGTGELTAGLVLENNAGAVRANGCRFQGARGYGDGGISADCCDLPGHYWGWDGATLDANSGGVAFVGCTFVGGRGANASLACYCGAGGAGGDALRISDGLVGLYDCSLLGGRGGANGDAGGIGGAGVRILAPEFSGVFASNTTFQAGNGGNCYDGSFGQGGAGGDGVILGANTVAQFLECTYAGGHGGSQFGPDGVGQSGAGSVFTFSVPKLVLEAPRVVREGGDVPLTIEGRPGDVVNLFVGTQTPFQATAMWRGVLLARRFHVPGTPQLVGILGEIPASGVLTTTFHLPDLELGVEAENWFLQVWRNSPIDGRTLGSFAPITVLDPAF